MKKILSTIIITSVLVIGCKESATNSTTNYVKDNDIANTIATSLGNQSNGLTSNTADFVNLSKNGKMVNIEDKSKDQLQRDTIIHRSGNINENGDIFTWDYILNASSKFHLSNGSIVEDFQEGQTQSIDLTLSSTGTYEIPVLKGNDNIAATLNISGILPVNSSTIFLGGSYNRNGVVTGKSEGNSFTYNNSFSLSNIVISRALKMISSGVGTVKVIGNLTNSQGQSFNDYSYSGVITFLGNQFANLDITNDKNNVTIKYTINLSKGSAIKRF